MVDTSPYKWKGSFSGVLLTLALALSPFGTVFLLRISPYQTRWDALNHAIIAGLIIGVAVALWRRTRALRFLLPALLMLLLLGPMIATELLLGEFMQGTEAAEGFASDGFRIVYKRHTLNPSTLHAEREFWFLLEERYSLPIRGGIGSPVPWRGEMVELTVFPE